MAVISTSNFKYQVEPILNNTFDGIYKELAKEYTEIFAVKQGIQRQNHQEPVLFGLGLAPPKGQGDVITYDDAGTAGNATYVYVTYSLAFSITEELMEDGDHVDILSILTENLAFSMHYTKELTCANVLNNAFNTSIVGYDSQPLLSNSHYNGTGGTQSNTLPNPTALAQASVEQLLINISVAKNGRNLIVDLKPKKLIVPPQLVFQAERILSSVLQSGTNDNNLNAIKSLYGLTHFKLTRLSNPLNWFINTDAPRGLIYLDRRPINNQSMGDFDTGNLRYRSTMRFVPGWTDWLGLFGAQGTA